MKVIHYLNQFYGQAGGESMADMPLKVLDCPVGPGLAINQALNSFNSKIISTIICGDNYFSEHMKETSLQIKEILRERQPDLVIAGPAFNAGRYGIACGEILKAANELHIDAISAMNEENPGVQLYKTYGYIIPSAPTARGMKNAVTGIANLAEKIAKGQKIEGPDKEGYFPRGIRKNIFYEKTGAVRAIDMLLAKINGQPYQTELPTPVFSKVSPSPAIRDMKNAVIALVTSGGVVPTGNPDHLESLAATKYVSYSVEDFGGEDMSKCDVAHGGYDPTYAISHGNRVIPVDALLELKREQVIKDMYPKIYVTVGNGMPVDRATSFGDAIGQELKGKVDGVILTST